MSDAFHDRLVVLLPKLRAHAMMLCRNRTAADDLVQDAALHALAGRGSFIEGTNFPAWTHRILRNLFLSGLRRRRDTIGLDDAPPGALVHLPDAEDRLALRELLTAMQRLSADQRACLVMVAVDGMSYDEIADSARIAVGTAKSHVFRARKALHGMLIGSLPPLAVRVGSQRGPSGGVDAPALVPFALASRAPAMPG